MTRGVKTCPLARITGIQWTDFSQGKDMQQGQERLDETSRQAGEETTPPPQVANRDGVPTDLIAGKAGDTEAESSNLAASPASDRSRPDKFQLESRLIELGAALAVAQQLFTHFERDFYLHAFGRYDE